MNKGFFSPSRITATRKPLPLIAQCGACGLSETGCKTPFMEVGGKGKQKIMIVGEAPGETEDKRGIQFVGKTGEYLSDRLKRLGFILHRDAWTTNALICHPPDNLIKDKNAVNYCRPNLLKSIEEYKPETIILLGKSAVKSLIGFLWKEDVGDMNRWLGWQIPCQRFNCWICPTWHPSFLMRDKDSVKEMMFVNHLKEAIQLEGRPYEKVPNYKDQVTVLLDTNIAAKIILKMARGKRPVAFDYETNMLKPDNDRSYILCCSVSDGKVTIAFPWDKTTEEAMRVLFKSPTPKIASNMKFEERWTRCKLKCRVRNWDVDTMLLSHVLDNRKDITSIKFQAFVKLGQEAYDDHIKPFLQSRKRGGYEENRIKDCDLQDLLLYCAMDSLLEWKVAKQQKKEMLNYGRY